MTRELNDATSLQTLWRVVKDDGQTTQKAKVQNGTGGTIYQKVMCVVEATKVFRGFWVPCKMCAV